MAVATGAILVAVASGAIAVASRAIAVATGAIREATRERSERNWVGRTMIKQTHKKDVINVTKSTQKELYCILFYARLL